MELKLYLKENYGYNLNYSLLEDIIDQILEKFNLNENKTEKEIDYNNEE